MKKLLLTTLLSCSLVAPAFADDGLSVTVGGVATYFGDLEKCPTGQPNCVGMPEFNSESDVIGITYNNWTVQRNKVGYYKTGYVGYYTWDIADGSNGRWDFGVRTGLLVAQERGRHSEKLRPYYGPSLRINYDQFITLELGGAYIQDLPILSAELKFNF